MKNLLAYVDETGYVPRLPEVIRREGNRLKGQKSLYLGQHDHNPVDWYPWGEESLSRARREDKPIFLSVGYSACHWCHVMEKEVFEDDAVAEFMNIHFINIKVDREERPDLDKVYMDAVLALTGSGGWPMSVFLTPERKPFFAGTYFPRDQFMSLLARVEEVFRNSRDKIDSQAELAYTHVSRGLKLEPGAVDDQMFDQAVSAVRRRFDPEWGGLMSPMKFPMPVTWLFLLRYYRKSGDPEIGKAIRATLDQMGSGGLQDHVAGGFHRYTVERTWLIPHFEKMLYDNALLASLYLEAAAVFEDERYSEIAQDTLDFLIREMSADAGGFYSSFDADSQGVEGAYYLWTPEEINAVAGKRDGPLLSALLGVEPDGNFEGKSILTRRSSQPEAAGLFDKYRAKLREARNQRVPPGLDRKVITSWNGLVISALAQGYAVFSEERYRRAAGQTADFLMAVHRREDGGLYRSSNAGVAEHDGILDDYAFLARGLLDLYQVTGELVQLRRALELIGQVQKNFRHPEAVFYLTPEGHEAPLGRQVEVSDGVRPSGNSAMLMALLVAAALTGDEKHRKQVKSDLDAYAKVMRMAGIEMAGWLDVALSLQGPFYEVVVAGDPRAAGTRKLVDEFGRLKPANAVLTLLPADGPSPEMAGLMPAVRGKRALGGKPTAFVCQLGSCKQPTHDPEELRRQIQAGWKTSR